MVRAVALSAADDDISNPGVGNDAQQEQESGIIERIGIALHRCNKSPRHQ